MNEKMKKIKSKKGILFSLISIIIVTALIIMIRPTNSFRQSDKIPNIKQQIYSADLHVESLSNQYIENSLVDTTQRAMRAYHYYLTTINKDFADDVQTAKKDLRELIINGSITTVAGTTLLNETNNSIYGDPSLNTTLLENATLTDRITAVEIISNESFHYQTNFSIRDLVIFQSNETGPWNLGVHFNFTLYLNASFVSWKFNKTMNITTTILRLNDTFYHINTYNSGTRDPVYMVFQQHDTPNPWNASHFENLSDSRTYTSLSTGLSYLQRLANSTDQVIDGVNLSKCCGIESIINKSDSYKKGGALNGYYNRSFIDYCYFLDNCPVPSIKYGSGLHNITRLTTATFPMQIDTVHIERYNLTNPVGEYNPTSN